MEQIIHLRTNGFPVKDLMQGVLHIFVGVHILEEAAIESVLYLLAVQYMLDEGRFYSRPVAEP
jgi:hypothetical protein